MSFNIIHEYKHTVDAEQATEWLLLRPEDVQRPIKDQHVDNIYRAMKLDKFVLQTTISFVRFREGNELLIDGQHRLSAISKHPDDNLVYDFNIQVYQVQDKIEMSKLMTVLDQNTSRNTVDQLRAMGLNKELSDLYDFNDSEVRTMIHVVSPIYHKFAPNIKTALMHSDHDATIDIIREYAPYLKVYLDVVKKAKKNTKNAAFATTLKKTGIMAVALVMLKEQPELAKQFWGIVAGEDKSILDKGYTTDAPVAFSGWIGEFNAKKEKTNGGRLLQHMFQCAVAACWNAFLDKKSFSSAKVEKATKNTGRVYINKTSFSLEHEKNQQALQQLFNHDFTEVTDFADAIV